MWFHDWKNSTDFFISEKIKGRLKNKRGKERLKTIDVEWTECGRSSDDMSSIFPYGGILLYWCGLCWPTSISKQAAVPLADKIGQAGNIQDIPPISLVQDVCIHVLYATASSW